MSQRCVDRLQAAVINQGPLCVGLDPVFERLPEELKGRAESRRDKAKACGGFARLVVDAVADIVGVVKIQVACFERFGATGYQELEETVEHARRAGMVIISDCKRGDIGSTMQAYVDYHLSALGADAMTLSPYMGRDVFSPLEPLLAQGKGAFFLVRTSNPGAAEVQSAAGDAEPLYRRTAALVTAWQRDFPPDESDYLPAGAVVGATAPQELAELRRNFPSLFFLVPGYGFQGGTAQDVSPAFDSNGGGAVVNASRSVLYAFRLEDGGEQDDWQQAVRQKAQASQAELGAAAHDGH